MNYPNTVAEVVNSSRKYRPAVLRAVKQFRRQKAWQGTLDERKVKFQNLHMTLCELYGMQTRLEIAVSEPEAGRGNGMFAPSRNLIRLVGKLSVVTYLHEFAHAAFAANERLACAWSINLYRRIFPRSAERMQEDGHMIVEAR